MLQDLTLPCTTTNLPHPPLPPIGGAPYLGSNKQSSLMQGAIAHFCTKRKWPVLEAVLQKKPYEALMSEFALEVAGHNVGQFQVILNTNFKDTVKWRADVVEMVPVRGSC
jgi:hypothetical protein